MNAQTIKILGWSLISVTIGMLFGMFIGGLDQVNKSPNNPTPKNIEAKKILWSNRPILPSPPHAPPSIVKVGPYIYTVHYTSGQALLDDRDALAETRFEPREIWLNPNSNGNLQVYFLHELIHIAKNVGTDSGRFESNYNDDEENMVISVATSLEDILQRNPEVVAWLTKPSKL